MAMRNDPAEAVFLRRLALLAGPLLGLSAWLGIWAVDAPPVAAAAPFAAIGFISATVFLFGLAEPEVGLAGARLNFIDPIVVCSLLFGGPWAGLGVLGGYVAGDFAPLFIDRLGHILRSERILEWVERDERFALLRRSRAAGAFTRIQAVNVAALFIAMAVALSVCHAVFGSVTLMGGILLEGYVLVSLITVVVALVVETRATRRGRWLDCVRSLPGIFWVTVQIWALPLAPGLLVTWRFGWPGLALYGALLAQLQFLSHRAGVAARIAAQRAEEARLAVMDGLTGVTNRRGLERLFEERRPTFVAVADIDHFKQVNDSIGHVFGDEALRCVARILAAVEGANVYVGRFGGEEFVVGVQAESADAVRFLCERIRRSVETDESIRLEDGTPTRFTVSIGYAGVEPGDDWTAAFKRADKALYKAKESGRNRVCAA